MAPRAQLMPIDCPAYILAGGLSTRFGSDKALVEIDGQPLLLRLFQCLVALGHNTSVVADCADRYQALGVSCLVDTAAASGPMAGVGAALQHRAEASSGGWLLMISVDQLLWQSEWFEELASAVSPVHDAVVFQQSSDVQPLPGLYHTRIGASVARQLAGQRLSLRNLLRDVRSVTIETNDNPRDWSFNTPDDLARIMRQR